MIKIIKEDLLQAKEDIIAHQTNCKGVMGSGVALQIKNKYPKVYKQYKKYCTQNNRLGTCQLITTPNKKIVNLFGQDNYGRDKNYTDYSALKNSLRLLKLYAKNNNLSVALPYRIGCGLAGGDWGIVYKMIEETFEDYNVTLYKYNT